MCKILSSEGPLPGLVVFTIGFVGFLFGEFFGSFFMAIWRSLADIAPIVLLAFVGSAGNGRL